MAGKLCGKALRITGGTGLFVSTFTTSALATTAVMNAAVPDASLPSLIFQGGIGGLCIAMVTMFLKFLKEQNANFLNALAKHGESIDKQTEVINSLSLRIEHCPSRTGKTRKDG
jgi:Trk-type K+ transport system membrane component